MNTSFLKYVVIFSEEVIMSKYPNFLVNPNINKRFIMKYI